MVIVDTHAHAGLSWFEPVEALLFQMDKHGVAKAVLVQYRGEYDNRYVLECVRKYPDRFCAVVLVDVQQTDACEKLEKWAREGAVGVRFFPKDRSPDGDPLAIWRKASELGLVVSCLGTLEEFASPAFRGVAKALPDLKIIVEHLAQAGYNTDLAMFKEAMRLAEYPNTYIKLGGLGEVLPRPFPAHTPPFDAPPPTVRMAYDAFGPKRMMWGSDYPPSGNREGYASALRLPMERVPFFTARDKEWVFGKTALAVWRF
jgi:L-fuconolactonase